MAARRERERRRPAVERRYRFGTPEPATEPEEELAATIDGEQATEAPPKRSRAGLDGSVATQSAVASTRGGARPAPRPYSDYRSEYAYVLGDLKRIALVVGSLLLILILLYFVLPR
jgi:hypothetical protein